MKQDEMMELLATVDETMLRPWLQQTIEKAGDYYENLVKSGSHPQDAMFAVVTQTAYFSMKHSLAIALAFMLLKPDRPLTKDEVRSLLKVIETTSPQK